MDSGLYTLHEAGWVHRNPENIIVDGKARVSDLEFAERRVAHELGEFSSAAKEIRTVGLSLARFHGLKGAPGFIAIEAHQG